MNNDLKNKTTISLPHSDKLIGEIARGALVSLGGQAFFKGSSFFLNIVLARILGTYSYGLYVLGFTLITVFQRFSCLGLQNGVVRFGAIYLGEEDKARLKGVFISTFLIVLGSGIIFFIMVFSFSGFVATEIFDKPDLTLVIKLFALSLPFYSLLLVGASSFRVFRKMEYEVVTQNVFQPLSNLIILGIIFLLGYRLIGAISTFIVSSLLATILAAYLIWRTFPEIISKAKVEYNLKELLTYSFTMLLLGFSYILLLTVDRIMIGFFSPTASVGIYNAAAITAFQASIFLVSFSPIFLPTIAELSHKNQFHELEMLFKRGTQWIFIFTLPLSIILVLFSGEIMSIFGPEFKIGGSVLVILSLAQLVNASTGPAGSILTMSGRQKVELLNSSFLGVSNIMMNIFLIPRYGIIGAALATASSLILVNIVRLLEVYSFYKIHPYRYSYFKPIIAGFGGVIIWLLVDFFVQIQDPTMRLSGVVVFAIAYLIIFKLLGIDAEDRSVLQTIKGKIAFA